jgi:hypothetical protein
MLLISIISRVEKTIVRIEGPLWGKRRKREERL